MRKILIFAVLFILLPYISEAQDTNVKIKHDSLYLSTSELAEKIVEEAYRHLGTPYKYGANGPKRFDCTGFTCYVYNKFGFKLSRTSKDQAKDGRAVEGSFRNLQKGDILIFGSRKHKKVIGHAGIFIELVDSTGRDFRFIHASTKRGITVSTLSETYYSDRFLGARRVLPDIVPGGASWASVPADTLGSHDTTYVEASASDLHIVLLESGRWFYIDDNGRIVKPDSSVSIVLDGSGKWRKISNEGHQIPQLAESSRPSSVTKQPAEATREETTAIYHMVKTGDTLYSIASRYKTSVDKICRLNGITKKTILRAGKKLRVK